MPEATALLISTESSLAASCQREVDSIARLRLVIADRLEEAETYLRDGRVSLVLLHLTRREQAEEFAGFLQALAAQNNAVAALVIGADNLAEQGLALLRQGATDYLPRPLHLDRLAYLLDSLTVCARYTTRPAAPAPTAGGEVGPRAPSRVELLRGPEPTAVGGGEGSLRPFLDGLDHSLEALGARLFGPLPPGAEPLSPRAKLTILALVVVAVAVCFAVVLPR